MTIQHDVVRRDITGKLISSGYFQLYGNLFNEDDICKSFRKGKIKIALVFGEDFAEHLGKEGKADVQIIADATDPNTANTLMNYMRAILFGYQQSLNINKNPPVQIISEVKMMYNPEMKGVFMFVPVIIVVILLFHARWRWMSSAQRRASASYYSKSFGKSSAIGEISRCCSSCPSFSC